MKNIREKAKQLHESVNHTYSGYNYILHLDAVYAVYKEFKDEAPDLGIRAQNQVYEEACYLHDVIEDCRVTPNDLLNKLNMSTLTVKIIFALTNEKGWNRADRANDKYYADMRNVVGATFVKMCDRIANVRFSILLGSSMFEKYKKENDHFMKAVNADDFPKMKECLINLFK